MKSSPHLGPMKAPQPMTSHASPAQRAIMNRQQAARSNCTIVVPPLQPVNNTTQNGHESIYSLPPSYPRRPSQTPSPSTSRPSGFSVQGVLSSSTSNFPSPPTHQQQRQQQQRPQRNSFSQQSAVSRPMAGTSLTRPISIPGESWSYCDIDGYVCRRKSLSTRIPVPQLTSSCFFPLVAIG